MKMIDLNNNKNITQFLTLAHRNKDTTLKTHKSAPTGNAVSDLPEELARKVLAVSAGHERAFRLNNEVQSKYKA